MITLCGQILVSRTDDDRSSLLLPLASRMSVQNVPVCTLKTSPCMRASHARVFQHVRVVPFHTGTFRVDTRGFQPCHTTHTTPTTTPRTLQHKTQHNITQDDRPQTDHNKTTKTERREDGSVETRQDRTGQDRTGQEKTRQDKNAREDERGETRQEKREETR